MTKIKTTSRYLLTLGIIALSVVSVVVTQRAQASSAIDSQQLAETVKNATSNEHPVYLDPNQPLETRVEDLLSRMTFEEKLSLVHGDSKFTSAALPRFGIP